MDKKLPIIMTIKKDKWNRKRVDMFLGELCKRFTHRGLMCQFKFLKVTAQCILYIKVFMLVVQIMKQ